MKIILLIAAVGLVGYLLIRLMRGPSSSSSSSTTTRSTSTPTGTGTDTDTSSSTGSNAAAIGAGVVGGAILGGVLADHPAAQRGDDIGLRERLVVGADAGDDAQAQMTCKIDRGETDPARRARPWRSPHPALSPSS